MVIAKVSGGLANQMFPYAAGRRLAHALGTELKLDLSGFADYAGNPDLAPRKYGLGVFNIQERFASAEEVAALTQGENTLLRRLLGKKPRRPASYVKEKGFGFDPGVLELSGDVYLQGNWNSEKYFSDISDILRREFSFKQAPSGKNLELIEQIASVNAVSLHVRRGDYVSISKVNEVHGTCSLDYYHRCVEKLAQSVDRPHFFVFSDDPQWVMDNLRLSFASTYVTHNGPDQGHEDLRLMSHCRHHIIANSGFSWWGAWLNPDPGKIVLAPKKWFATPKYDTSSLIPEGWLRL
ncbi:alpha-1,2-fucosyltransferase [Desulfuromonas versatilis]|uniref:Alpha-1,2-fucosyltransferase n=1 Tax=Desulfuromonas versatilis TaxID=2802975 RepID=A0ABM8HWT4_9BACT|nr:alpha-1,2-fucosyltransferase [Desulfuromonas versatilis]BCR05185.1 alpha-1,2-fucosyltransferase [Desulfuromonas versatilis]